MPPFLGAFFRGFPSPSTTDPSVALNSALPLRSLYCYPQEFCYFAQISCCPRQFRYRGVLRSGYGRNRDTSEIGEEIAMRVGNFLDQRVSPQHPQFPAHGCAAASALGSIGRFTTVEQAL